LPDYSAEKEEHVRVIDESGEDYLYPVKLFVPVEVSEEAERALSLASLREQFIAPSYPSTPYPHPSSVVTDPLCAMGW
jgi:hypothetical protein